MKNLSVAEHFTQLEMIRKTQSSLSQVESMKQDLRSLKPGAVIAMRGENYRVEERSRYQEGQWKWYEYQLMNLINGTQVFLEWEFDDQLELSLYDRKIKFAQLDLSPDDLSRMDNNESGSFRFQGTKWIYEESDEALYFRGEKGSGEKHYYWSFHDSSEKSYLSIDRYEGNYEVNLGGEVLSNEVRVRSLK